MNKVIQIYIAVLCCCLSAACLHSMPPIYTDMNGSRVIEDSGQPDMKWIGENGIECWKYIGKSYQGKGGTWFMILKNGESFKIVPRRLDFSSLEIGLPEDAVTAMLGRPNSVSATENIKYLNYLLGRNQMHYVRVVDGFVESYGRMGDFDSTKVPEQTLNVNVK